MTTPTHANKFTLEEQLFLLNYYKQVIHRLASQGKLTDKNLLKARYQVHQYYVAMALQHGFNNKIEPLVTYQFLYDYTPGYHAHIKTQIHIKEHA